MQQQTKNPKTDRCWSWWKLEFLTRLFLLGSLWARRLCGAECPASADGRSATKTTAPRSVAGGGVCTACMPLSKHLRSNVWTIWCFNILDQPCDAPRQITNYQHHPAVQRHDVMTHVNLLCWQCSDPLGPAGRSGCQTFCWRARCSKLALKGMHCVIVGILLVIEIPNRLKAG